jgi:hypothetical protein
MLDSNQTITNGEFGMQAEMEISLIFNAIGHSLKPFHRDHLNIETTQA